MPYTLLDNLAALTSGEKLKQVLQTYLSFFGLGFIPFMPGTFGTLGALPIAYFSLYYLTHSEALVLFIFVTILNYALWHYFSLKYSSNEKDPKWMVQDEVSGILLTCLIIPRNIVDYLDPLLLITTTFVLFRFFDIIKFFPASYYDKQTTPGAVIHDDIISGFYAGIVSFFIFSFFS